MKRLEDSNTNIEALILKKAFDRKVQGDEAC
jgi:hypothetical protein